MVAVSNAAVVGLFTITAVLVTGFFNWLVRRGDREAAAEQRRADAADRRDERRAAEMERWRETGAEVLAKVREFVTDVHPHRVMIPIQKGIEQEVKEKLLGKWETVREPIARLAVGHPSTKARELADEVSVGMHNVLNRVTWVLHDFARGEPWTQAMIEATEEWEQLNERVKALREALHDVEPSSAALADRV